MTMLFQLLSRRSFVQQLLSFALGSFLCAAAPAAQVFVERYQWSTVGETRLYIQMQNDDGGPGWGAVYKWASLNLGAILDEVVATINQRNPAYPTPSSVYSAINYSISSWPPNTAGVHLGWHLERHDDQAYIRFYNEGELFPELYPDLDYALWRHVHDYPQQSSLTLIVRLGTMLDFNGNGRTDADEALVWDGTMVGDTGPALVDDYYPTGFQGAEGLGAYRVKVPRFSVGISKATPVVLNQLSPGTLRLSWPVTDLDYIDWWYLVQRSPNLTSGSWANLGLVKASTSGTFDFTTPMTGERGFFRLLMHNSIALTPRIPSPPNETSGHPKTPTLTWSAADGAVGYDVYFGTQATPGPAQWLGTFATPTAAPSGLEFDTTYYWRVDAKLEGGIVIAGPVWSFRTMPSPTRFEKLSQAVGPAGASYILNILSTEAWTLQSSTPWVSLSATSGTGNATVTVTAAPNTTATERMSNIQATGTAGYSTHVLTQLERAGSESAFSENWETGVIEASKWSVDGPPTWGGIMAIPRVMGHSPALGAGSLSLSSSTTGSSGTFGVLSAATFIPQAGTRIDMDVRIAGESDANGNYTLLALSNSPLSAGLGAATWGPGMYRKYNQPQFEMVQVPGFSVSAAGSALNTWQKVSMQFLADGSVAWMMNEHVVGRSAPASIDYGAAPPVRIFIKGQATGYSTTANGSMSDNLQVLMPAQ